MHIYSFEKLDVWKLSMTLRKDIFLLTAKFPKEETFGLTSQIKRSSSSIGACLAEGSGKITAKAKRIIQMAYTTTLETLSHLIAALDFNYITEEDYIFHRAQVEIITIKLSGLRNSKLNT